MFEEGQFHIIKVGLFKISNPDSLGIKLLQNTPKAKSTGPLAKLNWNRPLTKTKILPKIRMLEFESTYEQNVYDIEKFL